MTDMDIISPNMRRIIRSNRLLFEMGYDDTIKALQDMQKMQRALKVIHTWSGFPPLDEKHVRKLAGQALNLAKD